MTAFVRFRVRFPKNHQNPIPPTNKRGFPNRAEMGAYDLPRSTTPFYKPRKSMEIRLFLNHFGFSSRHCFRCFSKALLDQQFHFAPFFPIGFMYGMFTYTFSIYNENQPNVGKHTIHGSYANFNCRLSLTFLAVQLAAYASSMRDQLLRDFHGEKNFHCRRIHGMVNLPRHLPYAIKSKQMYMGQNATHGTQCVLFPGLDPEKSRGHLESKEGSFGFQENLRTFPLHFSSKRCTWNPFLNHVHTPTPY